ncbi:MAG: ABC transporter ATP-binding protein [Alphaproteobacteria bacterium]|nr:ABC transporter ATP-binding protein [Alphaproteobacteria bacterium]
MALLETTKLSKSFGGLRAVSDLDIAIEPGTIHGLIGPNGSGKSTFFNLVTGVYQSDPGSRIVFDGTEITNMPSHEVGALGIARTFQLLRLFSDMTVLQNLMVGYHTHVSYSILTAIFDRGAVQRYDARTTEEMMDLLEFIGLADYAEMPASELSGGQRRLLALGRAMAMRPKLLMLDEPAAGLSPVNVEHFLAIVMKLKEKFGLTILIVEHILKVVMETCDTVTVLDYGEKIGEGTPNEVKDDHAVIEAYLGQEMDDDEVRAILRT